MHPIGIAIFLQCILICIADDEQPRNKFIVDNNPVNGNNQNGNSAGRALFSPRVDYNEWLPVGRADPLKNDPTFDYSPPVLDRVRYWGDNTNKEKKDILLIGVPSKRQFNKQQPQQQSQQPLDLHSYASNRRNFLMPEPATILMPPPMSNAMPMEYSSHGGFGSMNAANSYWESSQHINDALGGETTNGFLTVIKPKFVKNSYQGMTDNGGQKTPPMNQPQAFMNSAQSPLKKTQWLHSLLQKEITHAPVSVTVATTSSPTPQIVMSYSPTQFESHSHSHYSDVIYNEIKRPQPEIPPMIKETTTHFTPTTVPPPPSMTTDSLFSHYKQPIQPLKGPMYLIIQGHSKVKTYGPKAENVTEKHVPKMVPVVATKDPVISHVVSEDDKGNSIEVMHLHNAKATADASAKHSKNKVMDKKSGSTMDNLLSLLDTSFGGFFLNDNNDKGKSKSTKKVAGEKDALKNVQTSNATTIIANS